MDRFFQYPSHIQEIPRIREDLEFLKKEWAIGKSETRQVLVIIEEIFSNIVRYAFADQKEHHVDIRLKLTDGHLEIQIIDDGIAFNPLDYQLTPLSDPTTSDSGGMGLTLIRTFSNQIEYQRIAGKNHLKITKKVKNK
jgi:anti-sigma regulatory factor (Ser/Thr protein kinase)